MTKQKNTKQSLIGSVIALVLCFTMLIGTTLAWFTDEARNSGNKVQAGTLKVDLLKANEAGEYVSIKNETNSLFDSAYWEPNQTRVVYLSIQNAGNLDLKYDVDLEVEQLDPLEGYTKVDLTEVLQYTITPDAVYGEAVAWDADQAKAVSLGMNSSVGGATMEAGETHYFALAVHMDKNAGNAYQGNGVDFDINVVAEQIKDPVMEALYEADALLYDESILDWVASLYDPGTGGFYYSLGSRNNEGYLTDLESTYQAVFLMETLGFIGEGANEDILPEALRNGFMNFARDRQAEDDGYFYDTQFGKYVTVAKRGRDYSWGKTLVVKFNGDFKYTLAEDRIATTMVATASQDTPVADHLTSEANFRAYLESLDWETSAYGNGNTLAAQIPQIKAAGLMDVAIEFFKEIQNPETGMWGAGDLSVNHTNAAMKISGFFTKDTEPYPNIDKMMASFATIYENMEMKYITDVYNPLVLVSQAKNSYEELPEAIMGTINEKLVEIINLTAERTIQFRKSDNAYGNNKTQGQEYAAGVKKGTGANESDMDATKNAFSIRAYLYDIAGVEAEPLFDEAVRDAFIADLMDNEPITKQPIQLPDYAPTYDRTYDKTVVGCNETFDDIPVGYMPGGPWTRWASSKGVFQTELDPTDSNNVVASFTKDVSGLDINWIDMNYGTSGGKNVVSLDIMLDSSTGSALLFENELAMNTAAFWFIEGADGETFDLSYSFDYYNKTTFFENANYDQWYNLKFVYDPATYTTEFYVDGVLKATGTGYYGQDKNYAVPQGIDRIKFSAVSGCTVKLLIDNVSLAVENQ